MHEAEGNSTTDSKLFTYSISLLHSSGIVLFHKITVKAMPLENGWPSSVSSTATTKKANTLSSRKNELIY
jgi:hypothetical protein